MENIKYINHKKPRKIKLWQKKKKNRNDTIDESKFQLSAIEKMRSKFKSNKNQPTKKLGFDKLSLTSCELERISSF